MSRRFFVGRALGIPGSFAVGLGLAWLMWRMFDATPALRAEKCDAIYDPVFEVGPHQRQAYTSSLLMPAPSMTSPLRAAELSPEGLPGEGPRTIRYLPDGSIVIDIPPFDEPDDGSLSGRLGRAPLGTPWEDIVPATEIELLYNSTQEDRQFLRALHKVMRFRLRPCSSYYPEGVGEVHLVFRLRIEARYADEHQPNFVVHDAHALETQPPADAFAHCAQEELKKVAATEPVTQEARYHLDYFFRIYDPG